MTRALTRKKTESDEPSKEKLKRVLNFFDLTALGTGATLGSGVYVLAGAVAKSIAGPAVVVSFVIAAVVSAFSGKKKKCSNELVFFGCLLSILIIMYSNNSPMFRKVN